MRICDYDGRVRAAYEAYIAAVSQPEPGRMRLRTVYFNELERCEHEVETGGNEDDTKTAFSIK